MTTQQKYCALPPEGQREVDETWALLRDEPETRPDEYRRIVDFYYDEYTRPPEGWFRWWAEA